jgi:hypothetical protein
MLDAGWRMCGLMGWTVDLSLTAGAGDGDDDDRGGSSAGIGVDVPATDGGASRSQSTPVPRLLRGANAVKYNRDIIAKVYYNSYIYYNIYIIEYLAFLSNSFFVYS